MQTTTRFAPSPTGALHIGGVRTALYNWLYAKHMKGECILRIEDTDKQRSSLESSQQIIDTLGWLGFDYSSVYYQSKRSELYQNKVQKLLDEGKAYYCHCSPQRLDKLREQQMASKQKPRYDDCCRDKNLANAEGAVIRLRSPKHGFVSFDDAVRGNISINNQELDDLILMRSDGSPTYNLSCAIDDAEMGITLVMRGDDHINNTPRQIHIYQALGYPEPKFAHLPMILGADGKRLSKRHGALSALEYRDLGFLPDALLNYLARLGWSHSNQEIFTRNELTNFFNLSSISKSPASYSTEKLKWTNKQHLKETPIDTILKLLNRLHPTARAINKQTQQLIPLYLDRCDTLIELSEALTPYTSDDIEIDQQAAKKHLRPVALEPLQQIKKALQQTDNWQADELHQVIETSAQELNLAMGKVGMPLRVAITGRSFSPALGQVLACMDKETVIARIDAAINTVKLRQSN